MRYSQHYAWAHRDRIQPGDVLRLTCTAENGTFCAFRLESGRDLYILKNNHPEARKIHAGDSIQIRCMWITSGINMHGMYAHYTFRAEEMGLYECVLDGTEALALPVVHQAWDGVL